MMVEILAPMPGTDCCKKEEYKTQGVTKHFLEVSLIFKYLHASAFNYLKVTAAGSCCTVDVCDCFFAIFMKISCFLIIHPLYAIADWYKSFRFVHAFCTVSCFTIAGL